MRTLHTHGTVDTAEAAGVVMVDDVVVHAGKFTNGILFNFITECSKHGKVHVTIDMLYGAITITNVRVTYPAQVNGSAGFIDIPQPIDQPFQPNLLPLSIGTYLEYDHYMFNGPAQWIVNWPSTTQTVVLDYINDHMVSGKLGLDWQYQHIPVDQDTVNDITSLK